MTARYDYSSWDGSQEFTDLDVDDLLAGLTDDLLAGGDLDDALRRLLAAGIPLDGASDHGVSEALYLRDPDGNGVELYRDRPRAEWPHAADGSLAMVTRPLDLKALLREAAPPATI